MNLQEARQKIDELDKVLITTFEQRLKVILEIAKIKEQENIGIYEPEREQEVLAKSLSYVQAGDLKGYVNNFVNSILDISKTCQKQHMQQHIFLIGMPGAGKTTVGKALAQHQGMEFYDLDG